MININTEDNSVLIKPFDKSVMPDAAILFNSDSDIRYATGISGNVSLPELEFLFDSINSYDTGFAAGIYTKGKYGTSGHPSQQFAGICSGMLCDKTVWLRQLLILPLHRRKGIGRKAAELVFSYLKRSYGVMDIFLSVLDENKIGLSFWEELGFCEKTIIKKELFAEKHPHNVIIMQKRL